MSTSIEWTDETWNPFVGCSKISPGCEHCYAIRVAARQMCESHLGLTEKKKAGPNWTGEVRFVPSVLARPLHWEMPRRVFVCSMSDLFHESTVATEEGRRQIAAVFGVMAATPHITYQVLTKRPDSARCWFEWVGDQWTSDRKRVHQADVCIVHAALALEPSDPERWEDRQPAFPWPLPNVWMGTTVEDKARATRLDALAEIPAAVHFVSVEPMLEDLDLSRWIFNYEEAIQGAMRGPMALNRDQAESVMLRPLDWVICGGESGPGARPMHPDWARSLRDQCARAGTPFFFKQWGGVRKGLTGRELDGQIWGEFPRYAA